MEITYDIKKAASNQRKHGIGFDEAQTALLDENALVREDADNNEQRLVLLRLSAKGRLLVVVYQVIELETPIIRLISARKATSNEERYYG